MVFFRLADNVQLTGPQVAERLRQHEIWVGGAGERSFRLVTHYWITPEHIDRVVAAFKDGLV
jgi:threonine aldolase